MSMTIKELATKQNITKSAVYVRMNEINDFKNKYTKMINGKRIINKEGVRLLLRRGRKHNNINTNNKNNITINILNKELKDKDNQIKEINNSNRDLRKLLDQQQQLQLSSQQELKRLRSHIKKIDGPQNKKHGFFWRLFH